MKQLQHAITFSLIIALTGLSPMVVAEHQMVNEYNQASGAESPLRYHLSLAQMDGIYAGVKVPFGVDAGKSHQTHSGNRVTIGSSDTGKLKEGARGLAINNRGDVASRA